MDVSDPARVALPPATSALLRVLAGADAGFTIRQAARLAGVSHAAAQAVMRRLAEHGVVETEPVGRAVVCRLNRDHLATGPLVALATLRSALLELLREQLSGWQVTPLHASLYGSAARGDGDARSDLDILLVRPDGASGPAAQVWSAQLLDGAAEILRRTGNPVSWADLSLDELRRADSAGEAVVAGWYADAVHLWGRRLSTLRRAG